MKVAFYHRERDYLVEVEAWDGTVLDARLAAVHLKSLYQTGSHRMPSPFWVAWQEPIEGEWAGVYVLDDDLVDMTEAMFDRIMALTEKS